MKREKSKKIKRLLSMLLVFALMVSVCACGKKDKNNQTGGGKQEGSIVSASEAKQNVFREIPLGVQGDNVNFFCAVRENDRVKAVISIVDYSNPNPIFEDKLLSMNFDGGDMQEIILARPSLASNLKYPAEAGESEAATEGETESVITPRDTLDNGFGVMDDIYVGEESLDYYEYENCNMIKAAFTKDGNILGLYQYNYNFNDYITGDYEYIESFIICQFNPAGEVIWEKELQLKETEDEWFYPQNLIALSDGSIVLLIAGDKNYYSMIDENGTVSPKKEMNIPETVMYNAVGNITTSDDQLLYLHYNEDWSKLNYSYFDLKTMTLGEPTELSQEISSYSFYNIYQGAQGDFVFSNEKGIYSASLKDQKINPVMNFINSDMSITINSLYQIDQDTLLVMYYDNYSEEYSVNFSILKRVAPEDIPDKETILLGGVGLYGDILRNVIEFNKKSTTSRIVVKDYMNSADYEQSFVALNNDIIAGKMPDILYSNGSDNIDIRNFAKKGLLADVGRMISEDPELSQNVYMSNVMEALKINGVLYSVVDSFSVSTLIGKKSIVGEDNSWTPDEFMQIYKSLGEDAKMMDYMTRSTFLYQYLFSCGNEFVDPETGRCSFNDGEFEKILELAKLFPEEYEEPEYYDWSIEQNRFREDRCILYSLYINNGSYLKRTINGDFGEPVSFVGMPAKSGNGSYLNFNSSYYISEKSSHKDLAWEFVRGYITEESQKKLAKNGWYLPIMEKYYNEVIQQAGQKSFWYDGDEKVEYDDTYYINDQEIIIQPLSSEQIKEVDSFIRSISRTSFNNSKIIEIVNEEAGSFFAGQKSAKEVCDIIQSRVQLFVDEQ